MNWEHSVIFEIIAKYCFSVSFVDYESYPLSSKGILTCNSIYLIYWSSELNSPIPIHFSLLIPKMSMFTLAISCLTTFNLPWFMDLMFQVPMQYCSLQHWTLLSPPETSTIEHHFCFCLVSSFFLEILVILLCSSAVAYWILFALGELHPGVISLCLYTIHGVPVARILEWFAIFSSSGPYFVNTAHWPFHLGWPCLAWLTASLSYASPFTIARLWSIKQNILKILG